MLTKTYRLHKNYQFRYVYSHGKVYSDGMLVMIVCASKRSTQTRIGISISKKSGKAHLRNRIKRRIRESVRAKLPCLRQGFHVVFAANSKYVFDKKISFAKINASVLDLLSRADLIEHHAV